MTGLATLARRTLGVGGLLGYAFVASSPQTVLNGGIPTMYAATGVQGAPLAFLVVMGVVSLLAVGYVAVSQHVPHGAPFYAQLALGLGPTWGLIAAGFALVGYNCLQASLLPLIGTSTAALVGLGQWWMWALLAWGIVLALGMFPGAANARMLGVLLACEIGIVVAFDIAAFANPADGVITFDGFAPSNLFTAGGGAAMLVFALAAFAGAESILAFGEEARSPAVVVKSMFLAFVLLGVLYALTAWAYASALGAGNLGQASSAAGEPMAIMRAVWGPAIGGFGTLLLITSVLAAMAALAGAVARYVFALGREQVLPARFASVTPGRDGGAPKGGAIVQSVISAGLLAGFVFSGADPMKVMFVWLSTIGAVCVLVLLTLSSWSASGFFAKGNDTGESAFVRQVAPQAGGVVGLLALLFMGSNLGTLLGQPPGSSWPWTIGILIAGVVLILAVCTGAYLKDNDPQAYAQLGKGTPDPLFVQDARITGDNL